MFGRLAVHVWRGRRSPESPEGPVRAHVMRSPTSSPAADWVVLVMATMVGDVMFCGIIIIVKHQLHDFY